MKYLLILALLFVSGTQSASSQVLLPDITSYSSCPLGPAEVSNCTGWRQPTRGSSDYYNSCASSTSVGVPQNFVGYQEAVANAYFGLLTCYGGSDYKEYIGTTFAPLAVGYTYSVTVTVSLSEFSILATDGIGVYFSTYEVNDPMTSSTLPLTPQIDYSNYGIITDKTNWVTLSKTFRADSAYTHLVVGSFKPVANLQIDTVASEPNNPFTIPMSYYYIGDVKLETELISTFPNAFTPNNDAHNDVFRIINNPSIEYNDYTLSIFNRWGQQVFLSRDAAIGWDGTFNNTPQDMGTYFYLAEFTINGTRERIKGDVTLIR